MLLQHRWPTGFRSSLIYCTRHNTVTHFHPGGSQRGEEGEGRSDVEYQKRISGLEEKYLKGNIRLSMCFFLSPSYSNVVKGTAAGYVFFLF